MHKLIASSIVLVPLLLSNRPVGAQSPPAPAPAAPPAAGAAAKPAPPPAPVVAPAPAGGAPAGKPAAAPAAKPAAPAAAPAAAPPAAAPAAPAAKPAPPPPPKPAAELDTFKFFLGRWRCEGKAHASPVFGPEHPVKGSAEAKLESDGFWQTFLYEEKKTKEHQGLKVRGLWGFDQGAKRFVRVGAGNHGEWDTASAPGWEGDKLVWTGELSGPMGRMPFHHTFTKKGDKEWLHVLEVRGPDGKWSPAEEMTCKK
jgi:hypothetical protein